MPGTGHQQSDAGAVDGVQPGEVDDELVIPIVHQALEGVLPPAMRRWRDLIRRRAHLQQDKNRIINRMAGLLERANVPERDRPTVKYRMRVAYGQQEAADGRRLLLKLHDELLQSNPSAAASPAEGLEDCLTVAELRPHSQIKAGPF